MSINQFPRMAWPLRSITIWIFTLLLLAVCSLSRAATYEPSNFSPPKPEREMRAAWVATVGNIDWPSKKGLSTAEQKAELIHILDRAAELKLNVVIFQVRPACDAMYASKIEPWSEFLTGTMGQAPEPYYDPLAFAVTEAHARGLELHAWFNPYRARPGGSTATASANHISKTHPELARSYGTKGMMWLDPGEKAVQDYSLRVVMDVVNRYDVDGIHFDDYFYPYKESDASGREQDFPDDASWRRYSAKGKLSRADWRRENVDNFIERVYTSIKAAKPSVKFGISPFGIWKPGTPPQIKGFDAYDSLYADSRKWLASGWCDYFAPQLYWSIEVKEQSFPVLLKWWTEQNPNHRIIAPGLDTTKTGRRNRPSDEAESSGKKSRPGWPNEEILNQIKLTRSTPGVEGHVHWNMRSLMRNTELDEALIRGPYDEPALVPACPGRADHALGKPNVSVNDSQLKWTANAKAGKPWLWVVQTKSGGNWTTKILTADKSSLSLGTPPDAICVSYVDRFGAWSQPAALQKAKAKK